MATPISGAATTTRAGLDGLPIRSRADQLQYTAANRGMTRFANQPAPAVPAFRPGGNVESEISAGYQGQADALQRRITGSQVYGRALNAEIQKLSEVGDLNRSTYTAKRLVDMGATQDIDKQILDIRNKALVNQAALYEEVSDLPFEAQQKVMAARMGEYTDQVNRLSDLRESRISAATKQIEQEMDAYDTRVSAIKTRISGLEKAISIMRDNGADEITLAQMRVDHAKEQDRLAKERKRGDGQIQTREDMVENALVEKYKADYGVDPTGEAMTTIGRQAKYISKNNAELTDLVQRAGGRYGSLPVQTTTVPATGWFSAFRKPTVETTDIFEQQGYGADMPISQRAAYEKTSGE